MGWSIGYDTNWERDVGYGVPAICDHPDCDKEIDRGLDYICGGDIYGGEHGCGLFFCSSHLLLTFGKPQMCMKCMSNQDPFEPKPDVDEWLQWKLNDESWQEWRDKFPSEVQKIKDKLGIK